MKELSIFIKDEFIKNKLFEEGRYINTFEDVNNLVVEATNGNTFNVLFANSYLKDSFLCNLQTFRPDINIINCNSSLNRFYQNNFDGLLVFDNIKKCKEPSILEEIKLHNAILIC